MAEKIDNGIKMARIETCAKCAYNVYQSPAVRGNRWSVYCAYDAEAPESFGAPSTWRERDPEFMTGPEENCPLGLWADLEPVDLKGREEEARTRRGAHEKRMFGPLLAIALEGQPTETVASKIEQMVSEGYLSAEAAADMAAGSGQPE